MARVSRRVRLVAFRTPDFTSAPPQRVVSFTVLIRYRSPAVFSLGRLQPPFDAALPNSATRSNAPQTGVSPSVPAPCRATARPAHNYLAILPSGLLRLRSPLLPKSPLLSSPPSIDMLKSKGLPNTTYSIRDRVRRAVTTRYRALPRSSSHLEPIDPSGALSISPKNPCSSN